MGIALVARETAAATAAAAPLQVLRRVLLRLGRAYEARVSAHTPERKWRGKALMLAVEASGGSWAVSHTCGNLQMELPRRIVTLHLYICAGGHVALVGGALTGGPPASDGIFALLSDNPCAHPSCKQRTSLPRSLSVHPLQDGA